VLYQFVKIIVSAGLIFVISEISKKSSLWGGVLASVPLVSVLAIVWLYADTKDIEKVSALSTDIIWLIVPSLSFFILLPVLLKKGISFFPSLFISLVCMAVFYSIFIYALQACGIYKR
jgi:hypothetical protein